MDVGTPRPSPSVPEAGSSIAAPFGARALATGAWFWAPRRSVLATPIARAAPVTKSALSGAHSAQNAPVSQWRLRPIERPWRRARLRARSGLPGAARRAPPPTTLNPCGAKLLGFLELWRTNTKPRLTSIGDGGDDGQEARAGTGGIEDHPALPLRDRQQITPALLRPRSLPTPCLPLVPPGRCPKPVPGGADDPLREGGRERRGVTRVARAVHKWRPRCGMCRLAAEYP